MAAKSAEFRERGSEVYLPVLDAPRSMRRRRSRRTDPATRWMYTREHRLWG